MSTLHANWTRKRALITAKMSLHQNPLRVWVFAPMLAAIAEMYSHVNEILDL